MFLRVVESLFIISLAASQCPGALIKRSIDDDCHVQEITEHPRNLNVSVGQENVNLSCKFDSETHLVDWAYSLHNTKLLDFGISNLAGNPGVAASFTNRTGISLSETTLMISFKTIRPTHHGVYYCKINCNSNNSRTEAGFLRVMGKVVIYFYDRVRGERAIMEGNTNTLQLYTLNQLEGEAGQNVDAVVLVFGYPNPKLSLEKKGDDGIYHNVTDVRFSLSLTRFMIQTVQLEDSGQYRIWGNNSYGNTSFVFKLIVTGVAPPDITLSEYLHTSSPYQSTLRFNCSIQPAAYEKNLMLYWAFNNTTEVPKFGLTRQENSTNLTTTLVIERFEETDNGLYICVAVNSNKNVNESFTLIGPPQKMDRPNVSNNKTQIRVEWMTPKAFKANITRYIIQYENENKMHEETVNTAENNNITIISVNCTKGLWKFRIAAENQFNLLGEYSNYSSITIGELDATCISSSVSPTTSISSSLSSMATTKSSDFSSTPSISSTLSVTVTATDIPISAIGVASGVFILIIAIGILTVGILCWVMTTKRSSQRRARTQWHQPEDYIDYSNSTQSLPDKSPEPFFDVMGIPSPLPATPGYGPVYIDPCYEFPRENLDLTDILYDGSYTVIYRAKALGIKENKSIDVAVKSIKDEFLDMDDYVSTLVMEMEQLSQLDPHPNIVGLVRVCTVGRPVYMVMEYMCHGDLLGFLRATRGHADMYTVFPGTKNIPTNVKLTSRDLLNIINQVAKGMLFLSEQKIPHGALCARNVLVGTSMEVKIFNIGAHNLDNDINFESLVRWMAPEVFVDGVRTTYSDVWSFGVLMWEVVTVGGTPYSNILPDDLYTQLNAGMRLNRPNHCTQPVYHIMTSCWEVIPQHRPLFMEIIDTLNGLNSSKMSYLDLRNYNETQYSQFDFTETPQMSVL